MQRSFFQNENRHRLIEYDLYESCLKRQLFYTKWCWAVIASALSGQNERSYPDDRKKKGVAILEENKRKQEDRKWISSPRNSIPS